MNKLFFWAVFLASAVFISCNKGPVLPAPQTPVAKAGADIKLLFPLDSAVLDGSASYDPDGKVESYTWLQLTGPSTAEIAAPQAVLTAVRRLQTGVYLFELSVKDNSGLSSKDTVAVAVRLGSVTADAGPDQVIDMTIGRITLDGSRSADSSGQPLNFRWRQVSGPTAQINTPDLPRATVVFPSASLYSFELAVWNNNGTDLDTVTIGVQANPSCGGTRAEVPAQLTPLKQLSLPADRTSPLLAAGNKLIIPQEWDLVSGQPSNVVLVYDIPTGTVVQHQLSVARSSAGMTVAGNKVFFAGGFTNFIDDGNPSVSNVVDIFDVSTNAWSTATLSEARGAIKAGVAGNKVVFAGGLKSNVLSKRADVYDLQTGQWTFTQMAGEPRAIERVVADQSNIYFLGGYTGWENPTGFGFTLTTASKNIDIFNTALGSWSVQNMQLLRHGFSAALVNNQILIAGGMAGTPPNEHTTLNVEIITLPGMTSTYTCLALPTVWYGSEATAIRNGQVIFYIGRNLDKRRFDIYNPQTGVWSRGVHPANVLDASAPPYAASLAATNNQVYVLIGNQLSKLDY